MKRRHFLKTSTNAAAGAALAPSLLAQAGTGRAKKANLLVIHCDELNFRTLGCYRDTLPRDQAFMWGPQGIIETPHIDSIAREGAICTKFYAATPVCSPSRSSFISGQFPQNTPVTTNDVPLSDDIISFAETLGRAGYATGYAGKWHLDGGGKPQWAPERKFGFQDNRCMFNRGHWKQFEDTPGGPRVKAVDARGNPTYDVTGADETSFATDWLAGKTIEFIEAHKGEPFCYMVSIPDPHGPDTVRAPYDTMFDDDKVEKPRTYDKPAEAAPSWAKPEPRCHYGMASYFGMIKCIDDNVGRILNALRARNLLDDTVVVFTADHGDMRGEHHRQNKGIPLEASAKIPFTIRFPEKIAAGTRVDHVLNTVDFLPTILAILGVETAGREEGRDASAILATGKAPDGWDDITFVRGTSRPGSDKGWVSAVTPRHKLILSDRDEPWLLDLEEDPDELRNFVAAEQHAAAVRRLARELRAYGERHGDPCMRNAGIRAHLDRLAG